MSLLTNLASCLRCRVAGNNFCQQQGGDQVFSLKRPRRPFAHDKGCDRIMGNGFYRQVFPSPAQGACGPRGNIEYNQKADA